MSFEMSMSEPECPTCHRSGADVVDENITHNVNEIAERCLVAAGAGKGRDPARGYAERSWGRLDAAGAGRAVEA